MSEIKVPTMADMAATGETPEILFWVGCAGSFDDRYKKVTVAFSLNPMTLATLRIVASQRKISVSDLANQILKDHFTE